jgi:hypothetical protein
MCPNRRIKIKENINPRYEDDDGFDNTRSCNLNIEKHKKSVI